MSNFDARIFSYNDQEIRIFIKNGKPWFVLKDLCNALGLKNSTHSAKKLDDDEKEVLPKIGSFPILKVPCRGLLVVNESGLYEIVLRPFSPGTEDFVQWLIHEVLPKLKENQEKKEPDEAV
jgi:prophage antirepressor-like protein